MTRIGRYVKTRAKSGCGDELAERLLRAAEGLRATPGCEVYVINRDPGDPDAVWVTEVWRSQADLDAALGAVDRAEIDAVLALTDGPPERVDLQPVDGVGLLDAARDVPPYSVVTLTELEDAAAKHGFGESGSARFATEALSARATGVSLHRVKPGARQPFGHRHERAEEVYVVLSGGGRARLDDEEVELRAMQALRVAPPVTRAFEAGPDGMEILAVGPRTPGDAAIAMGWWGDDSAAEG